MRKRERREKGKQRSKAKAKEEGIHGKGQQSPHTGSAALEAEAEDSGIPRNQRKRNEAATKVGRRAHKEKRRPEHAAPPRLLAALHEEKSVRLCG